MIKLVTIKDNMKTYYKLGDDYGTNANTVVLYHGSLPTHDTLISCILIKGGISYFEEVRSQDIELMTDLTDLMGDVISEKGKILKLDKNHDYVHHIFIGAKIVSVGTVWQNASNNRLYTITGFSNVDNSDNEKYPETIIYKSNSCNRVYSRPSSDWLRSMTLLSKVKTYDNGATITNAEHAANAEKFEAMRKQEIADGLREKELAVINEDYPIGSHWIHVASGFEYKVTGHSYRSSPLAKGVAFTGITKRGTKHSLVDDNNEFISGIVRLYTSDDNNCPKTSVVNQIFKSTNDKFAKRDAKISAIRKDLHKLGEHMIKHIDNTLADNQMHHQVKDSISLDDRIRQRDILIVDVNNMIEEVTADVQTGDISSE